MPNGVCKTHSKFYLHRINKYNEMNILSKNVHASYCMQDSYKIVSKLDGQNGHKLCLTEVPVFDHVPEFEKKRAFCLKTMKIIHAYWCIPNFIKIRRI